MIHWHQYLMGIFFVIAGFFHIQKPQIYERIMPPYIPSHKTVILITGILEMIAGFLLMNQESSTIAAWGIIVMLICFLPVHAYMLQEEKASLKLPKWVLVLRIPLQFAIMYWAYQYA